MGAYAQCWLDDLFIGSTKDHVDADLISLFRSSDKTVLTPPVTDLPAYLDHYREALDEGESGRIVYYETAVDIVRDRLEVLGYHLTTAEEAFRRWIEAERAKTCDLMEESSSNEGDSEGLSRAHYHAKAEILAILTPTTWVEGLEQIRSSGMKTDHFGRYNRPNDGTVIGYMLSNSWYGFPGYDLFVPLRLAIEADDGWQSLIYDVTDLIWAEYFTNEDDFVHYGVDTSALEYGSTARTVVLTEGKTDAWVLSESLKLLYPHLTDYFSFLDFESSGFGGGVGNLANAVKAFSGAGIVNNVVALFDNDTAAAVQCKVLDALPMPANIAIKRLPRLSLLDQYPTMGPSGPTRLDVNGMAASIELYLGEDVLRDDDGDLVPVQWTGYIRQMKQYQGEVLEKKRLHKRFREKLTRVPASDGPEWDGLRAVLKVLFSAFADRNRTAICKRPAEYYDR